MMNPTRVAPVAAMLLASGCCALIYQVAWLGELRLVFGGATAASAAVTAIFMGGLGLGNALLDRAAERTSRPLAWYAKLELAVAGCAAISPWLLDLATTLYRSAGGEESLGQTNATLLRLGLSAIVLGVPAFLMGGTLPAAAVAVSSNDDPTRRSVAVLYGLNTLGAVVGALATTFWLLESLGPRVTIWLGCVINLAVAGAALAASPGYERTPGDEQSGADPTDAAKTNTLRPTKKPRKGVAAPMLDEPIATDQAWWVYATAAIAGFSFMLMELVWFRMLAPVLGGSSFTFGLILGVALLGVGLGGALYPLVYRGRSPTLALLALSCAIEALCLMAPYAAGDSIAELASWLYDKYSGGFEKAVADWFVIAALVVLPAAVVAGLQFPLFIALLGRGEQHVGRHVGRVYAWNTLGSIAGSLAGGFGMLPLFTAPGAWKLAAALLMATSLALLLRSYFPARQGRRLLAPLTVLALAALLTSFTGPTAVWRHAGIGAARDSMPPAEQRNARQRWRYGLIRPVVWEADGVEASLAINVANGLSFMVNGKSDGNSVGDVGTQIMCGMLGAYLHPAPKTALVIGLGTGESAGWLAQVDSIERVEVVEIEPGVAEMAKRCADVNFDVLHHPKVRVIYNDAREVIATKTEKFDLIASEPSNPYRAGISNLFTREFYQDVRARLNSGGVFVQFLQGYEVDEETFRLVLTTLRAEFAHVEVWQTGGRDLEFACFTEPPTYTAASLKQKLAAEPFKTGAALAWRAHSLEGMLARFVAGPTLLDVQAAEFHGGPNTDDFNRVEYGFVRTLGRSLDGSASRKSQRSRAFSVAMLTEQATAVDADRAVLDASLDWEAIRDERRLLRAVENADSIDRAVYTPSQQARADALIKAKEVAYPAAVAAWESQPQAPRSSADLALLALAYAERGDDQATPLLARLEPLNASEAAAIRAIWLWNTKRRDEAVPALADAIVRMRKLPFALPAVTQRTWRLACEVSESGKGRPHARTMLTALDHPWVSFMDDPGRSWACCVAAQAVDAPTARPYFEQFEPYPLWTKEFLERRAAVYAATSHPLAQQALADYNECLTNGDR